MVQYSDGNLGLITFTWKERFIFYGVIIFLSGREEKKDMKIDERYYSQKEHKRMPIYNILYIAEKYHFFFFT